MKSKSEHEKTLFKAGIFIILTVSLLIYSILWLRYFALLPDKTVIVKFKECGPISTGMPVYFQGVDIGKTVDIGFSKDFRYTLVKLNIYKKCMNLPKNVYAEIKTQGLTGQKYIDIIYPDNPSKEIIEDCDVIEGRLSSIQYLIKGLNEFVSKGRLNEAVDDFRKNAQNVSKVIKKIDSVLTIIEEILKSNQSDIRKLINQGALSASNLNAATGSIKNISSSPELNKNINSTITNFLNSSQNLDKAILGADKIISDIDSVTGNPMFQESFVNTFYGTDYFLRNLNCGELNSSLNKILYDTDRTINRYDCLGEGFGDLMSQRFLLMKLFFGKPGKGFEKCKNGNCFIPKSD